MLESIQKALFPLLGVNVQEIDLAILGFGLLCALSSIKFYFSDHNCWRALKWPKAMGTINSITIKERYSSSYEGGARSKIKLYSPSVSFSYTYNGKNYVSGNLSYFSFESSNIKKSKNALKPYSEGQQVMVRVNPKKPGQAIIELSIARMTLFTAAMSIFFVVFPILSVWMVINRIR